MRCVYCGGEAGDTKDHVPPKCLIRKPYPANLLTVPSCEECNNSSSEDEEYFRLLMDGLFCHTDEAELLFDGPISRSMDRNSNIEELMFGSLRGADRTVILDVDYPRIFRIAEKIARGLEFITTGVPFPVDQQFEIDFAEVEGTSSVAPYGPDFTYRRLAEEQGAGSSHCSSPSASQWSRPNQTLRLNAGLTFSRVDLPPENCTIGGQVTAMDRTR